MPRNRLDAQSPSEFGRSESLSFGPFLLEIVDDLLALNAARELRRHASAMILLFQGPIEVPELPTRVVCLELSNPLGLFNPPPTGAEATTSRGVDRALLAP